MRGNTERSQQVFIKMVNGKFAESVTKDTQGAVKRYSENKKEDVYERIDSYISGRITEIGLNKGTYGWEMVLVVRDVDEVYKIQIQTNSGHFSSFANKLPNINLNQDVYLEPYAFDDKEKKKSNGEPRRVVGMTVKQGGEKILNTYSKEKPIPDLVFPKGGDDEDVKMYYMQEEKFYRGVIQKYAGQFTTETEVKSEMQSQNGATSKTHTPEKVADPVDDLPF